MDGFAFTSGRLGNGKPSSQNFRSKSFLHIRASDRLLKLAPHPVEDRGLERGTSPLTQDLKDRETHTLSLGAFRWDPNFQARWATRGGCDRSSHPRKEQQGRAQVAQRAGESVQRGEGERPQQDRVCGLDMQRARLLFCTSS